MRRMEIKEMSASEYKKQMNAMVKAAKEYKQTIAQLDFAKLVSPRSSTADILNKVMKNSSKKDKESTFMVCTVIAILVAFYTLGTKGRMHRKHTYYKPTTDLIYYRDIPSNLDPNFAANLVFCKDFKQSKEEDRYSAILLSLVRKKYIELKKEGKEYLYPH